MANKKIFSEKTLAAGILFIIFCYALVVGWKIWHYPPMATSAPQAEFGIILGATTHGNRPTPVYRERVEEGIRLYRLGRIQKLIFTGKPGHPPQAIVGKSLALEAGIPATDILVETDSRTTLENLIYSQQILPERNSNLLIISDPLHLKRAMLMAEDLNIRAFPAPTQSTRIQSWGQRFRFVLREILAYTKYKLQRVFKIPQKKANKIQHN